MTTIYTIIGLFALGAIIGMYLLSLVLQKKETPKIVSAIHGLFVATALVLLIMYNQNNPGLTEAIVLFVIAVAGGLTLIVRDVTGKSLPRWLAIGHGIIAVTGFVVLLIKVFY